MSLRLILMRHAKSSWGNPLLDDHQRPLNGRGQSSATAMGNWLRQKSYLPDQILSSSSQRTRETCERLGLDVEPTYLDSLYHAGDQEMLKVLKGATGQNVLMIGHNPGIAYFAHELVKNPPNHPRFTDYPTCATLVAEFPADRWQNVEPGTGKVLDFVVPREIKDD